MPAFYNQATLFYNDQTALSNIVQGQLVEALSITKTAVGGTYRSGEPITYAVSILNAGNAAYTGLTLTDDLGAYTFGGGSLIPLSYVDGSARLLVNGVLQPAPTVAAADPLTITGLTVPAGGDAVVLYTVTANGYAPPSGSVTNTASLSGAQLTAPVTDSETVTAVMAADLSILKAIDPVTVVGGGPITYTFTIRNNGTVAAVATDNVTVTDLFDPILAIQSVTLNGMPLAEGAGYTYNPATGAFSTVPGVITVPGAQVQQDPLTGVWQVTPGTTVLEVVGMV